MKIALVLLALSLSLVSGEIKTSVDNINKIEDKYSRIEKKLDLLLSQCIKEEAAKESAAASVEAEEGKKSIMGQIMDQTKSMFSGDGADAPAGKPESGKDGDPAWL